MTSTGWTITFEIPAENEAADFGIELADASLRDALDIFGTRGYCAPNSYAGPPQWLARYDAEHAHTGAIRDLFLHIPARITPASRRRLMRALSRPRR